MKSQYRVVITDVVSDACEPEQQVLGDLAEVSALNVVHEEELIGRIESVDAIILYHTLQLTRRTLDRLTKCRFVLCCGVGYDNIDHAYARQRGIPVANLPDYGTEEVADSAFGMMLSLTRGIAYLNSRLRDRIGPWDHTPVIPLHRLRGRVMGIVGLGRIGTAVALRAKAIGMDVVFYDPYVPDGRDKSLGIRRSETLEDLLERRFPQPLCN